MDDRIRELRRAGWSERRIAVELGVTRHRVRKALESHARPTAISGVTWADRVSLQIDGARYREGDGEQLALAEFAYDLAEWLDEHGEAARYAERIAGSLYYVLRGVVDASNPLVCIHVRLARRLLALAGSTTTLDGREDGSNVVR